MRVIAGSAKGVRLSKVAEGVRPVSDRAREGVFSSLGSRVEGACVLDLYAGSGALAIESLSRGATHATLVERSKPALAAVRANLDLAHVADRATVVDSDVADFLVRNDKMGADFDLVFVDPPYEVGPPDLDRVMEAITRGPLAANATVVLTRGTRSSTPVIPVDWAVARSLRYGDTLVTLFRPDPRP